MKYKNISSTMKLVVKNMVKIKVRSGDTVILKPSDVNHTGSNMRYFQLANAEELVKKEHLSEVREETAVIPGQKPTVAPDISESDSPAPDPNALPKETTEEVPETEEVPSEELEPEPPVTEESPEEAPKEIDPGIEIDIPESSEITIEEKEVV